MTKKTVVIFCGTHATEPYLSMATTLGMMLARNGYRVVSGGGPGMMRAVMKGAFDEGGDTYGVCIATGGEDIPEEYMTHYEFRATIRDRQKALVTMGDAYIVLPGGLGTLYEAIEVTQLKKFGEIPVTTPLLFVGDYYVDFQGLIEKMDGQGFIHENLKPVCTFYTTIEEAINALNYHFPVTV